MAAMTAPTATTAMMVTVTYDAPDGYNNHDGYDDHINHDNYGGHNSHDGHHSYVQSGIGSDRPVPLTQPQKIFLINFTFTFLKHQKPDCNHAFHS